MSILLQFFLQFLEYILYYTLYTHYANWIFCTLALK